MKVRYMAKAKTSYKCFECDEVFPKWQGQCSSCKEWNTLEEVQESTGHAAERGKVSAPKNPSSGGYSGTGNNGLKKLKDVENSEYTRYKSDIPELDRILSGGMVKGGTHLISGEPGAGKSTLLLQYAASMAKQMPVLYTTGEESLDQISMRADRLKVDKKTDNLYLVAETDIESIIGYANQCGAKLIIVDSIQTSYIKDVTSSPGSTTQVRESASALNRFCKQNSVGLWLVGHYTKDGSVAGPKILEHIVDGIFVIEGESNSRYRLVRPTKYRFGSLETGFFAMMETGLKSVKNPSEIFLQRLEKDVSGSMVSVLWEGTRPILVELQALVEETAGSHPRRLSVGFDSNRVHMILAIIQKHAGLVIGNQDTFHNIVGGLKSVDTTTDLPLALATIGSFQGKSINRDTISFGELGLSGEVRAISNGVERIKEAEKIGFKYAIVPKKNIGNIKTSKIKLIGVETLEQAIQALDDNDLMTKL